MVVLIGLHNVIRWVVLVIAVIALVRAYRGWLRGLDYTEADRKIGVFFSSALDTQLLLGIILWIFGNWGYKAFEMAANLEGANRTTVLYFAVEHAITMLVALVLVHLGIVSARRAPIAKDKHKRIALFFTVAVLMIILAIPWIQRPLLPGI